MGWLTFLITGSNWVGRGGILALTWQHVIYSGVALIATCLVAIPLGAWLGHIHRGEGIVLALAGLGRAIPAFGIVVIFAVSSLGVTLLTLTITLCLFALPQVLVNTYTGVAEVDGGAVSAVRGIGYSEREVFFEVEVPLALPLIASGVRSAAVQIVATATIAAYAGAGGLGVIVFRGWSSNLVSLQVAGAVLVVLLALATQALLAVVQRLVTPRGLVAAGLDLVG